METVPEESEDLKAFTELIDAAVQRVSREEVSTLSGIPQSGSPSSAAHRLQAWAIRRDGKLEAIRRAEEEQREASEKFTFTPHINSTKIPKSVLESPLIERQEQWDRRRVARLEELRRAQDEISLLGCTFAPEITAAARQSEGHLPQEVKEALHSPLRSGRREGEDKHAIAAAVAARQEENFRGYVARCAVGRERASAKKVSTPTGERYTGMPTVPKEPLFRTAQRAAERASNVGRYAAGAGSSSYSSSGVSGGGSYSAAAFGGSDGVLSATSGALLSLSSSPGRPVSPREADAAALQQQQRQYEQYQQQQWALLAASSGGGYHTGRVDGGTASLYGAPAAAYLPPTHASGSPTRGGSVPFSASPAGGEGGDRYASLHPPSSSSAAYSSSSFPASVAAPVAAPVPSTPGFSVAPHPATATGGHPHTPTAPDTHSHPSHYPSLPHAPAPAHSYSYSHSQYQQTGAAAAAEGHASGGLGNGNGSGSNSSSGYGGSGTSAPPSYSHAAAPTVTGGYQGGSSGWGQQLSFRGDTLPPPGGGYAAGYAAATPTAAFAAASYAHPAAPTGGYHAGGQYTGYPSTGAGSGSSSNSSSSGGSSSSGAGAQLSAAPGPGPFSAASAGAEAGSGRPSALSLRDLYTRPDIVLAAAGQL